MASRGGGELYNPEKMMQRQHYANVWHTDLKGAIGADCPWCCLSIIGPCCVSYLLRSRTLYDDMTRYQCCGGYMPCSGKCGEQKCPQFCLCMEVTCCFASSVATTRFLLQDQFNIQTTPCDNCIILPPWGAACRPGGHCLQHIRMGSCSACNKWPASSRSSLASPEMMFCKTSPRSSTAQLTWCGAQSARVFRRSTRFSLTSAMASLGTHQSPLPLRLSRCRVWIRGTLHRAILRRATPLSQDTHHRVMPLSQATPPRHTLPSKGTPHNRATPLRPTHLTRGINDPP